MFLSTNIKTFIEEYKFVFFLIFRNFILVNVCVCVPILSSSESRFYLTVTWSIDGVLLLAFYFQYDTGKQIFGILHLFCFKNLLFMTLLKIFF